MARLARFSGRRFGVSFHFWLYATDVRSDRVRSIERSSAKQHQHDFQTFAAERYDAVQWAEVGKRAGARHAVLTAEPHDGLCLCDTGTTDYEATNTRPLPDGIDPVSGMETNTDEEHRDSQTAKETASERLGAGLPLA